MYNKEKNYKFFKLPIYYIKNKTTLNNDLTSDLELLKTVNNNKPIYELLFQPETELGRECLSQWASYYTNNKKFLEESQKYYLNCVNTNKDNFLVNKMLSTWKNIKNETNFYDKYEYIDIQKIEWLNQSSLFLCIMSFYNLSSPILNLLAPVFICIIPFILLKILNKSVTFENYSQLLIKQIKSHVLGKLFYSFNNVSLGQKVYILLMVGLYFYNIYQNILTCYKFYKNTIQITNDFNLTKSYLEYTIENIKLHINLTKNLPTYNQFNIKLSQYLLKLEHFYDELKLIPKNILTPFNIKSIGFLMKNYYELFKLDQIDELMHFSFGFNGYIDTLSGLSQNIKNKKINKVLFSNKHNYFKKLYHPSINKNPIKNNINLNKNIIITGPNASGKTTIIKATAINILFCHQIGFGYFKSAKIKLYKFLHCYINIPDTSSRDSLFQAEVRRCKNILDTINNNKKDTHFCIFDELFSGTNPYEAISTGNGYLHYLSNNKNVTFILTTHFIKLCKLLNNNKNIINNNMESIQNLDSIVYTYTIKKGISKVKGGISILKEFKYPTDIIKLSKQTLNKL